MTDDEKKTDATTDPLEKIIVSAGYDASTILLEEDSDSTSDPLASMKKGVMAGSARKYHRASSKVLGEDEELAYDGDRTPSSILPDSILTPPIDLEELERQVNSDYDDAPPISTPSDRSVDEEFDDSTISPCSMKILTSAGLDTFKGFLMDMGISGTSARFRFLFPREIGIRLIRLYQEKLPNNGGKTEMKTKKSLSKALGLTKRRKKIQNIKERKTLQKVNMIGIRVIEVVVHDTGMTKTRFKSPWTKLIYDKRPYPDWKIHEATLDAGGMKHSVTNEKMVIVEVNCTV